MAAKRRDSVGSRLAALLEEQRGVLVTGALGAGLARMRPRSSPGRIAREADRFVRMLGQALACGRAQVARLVREEVRHGALALAAPDEIRAVLDIWRRTLAAFLALCSPSERVHVEQMLALLARESVSAERRWRSQR